MKNAARRGVAYDRVVTELASAAQAALKTAVRDEAFFERYVSDEAKNELWVAVTPAGRVFFALSALRSALFEVTRRASMQADLDADPPGPKAKERKSRTVIESVRESARCDQLPEETAARLPISIHVLTAAPAMVRELLPELTAPLERAVQPATSEELCRCPLVQSERDLIQQRNEALVGRLQVLNLLYSSVPSSADTDR